MKKNIHKSCSQVFYRKTCSKNLLKDIRNSSKMRSFELWEKNNTACLLSFYKKIQIFSQGFPRTLWKNMDFITMKSNKNQSISCSNSGVITSQIELTNLTKARKSKKHSFFLVIFANVFFLSYFFPLLPVLPPAYLPSPLLYFVRNFLKLPGHVCYRFTHVNNISSLKIETIS